jgi:hypothetical protein
MYILKIKMNFSQVHLNLKIAIKFSYSCGHRILDVNFMTNFIKLCLMKLAMVNFKVTNFMTNFIKLLCYGHPKCRKKVKQMTSR